MQVQEGKQGNDGALSQEELFEDSVHSDAADIVDDVVKSVVDSFCTSECVSPQLACLDECLWCYVSFVRYVQRRSRWTSKALVATKRWRPTPPRLVGTMTENSRGMVMLTATMRC